MLIGAESGWEPCWCVCYGMWLFTYTWNLELALAEGRGVREHVHMHKSVCMRLKYAPRSSPWLQPLPLRSPLLSHFPLLYLSTCQCRALSLYLCLALSLYLILSLFLYLSTSVFLSLSLPHSMNCDTTHPEALSPNASPMSAASRLPFLNCGLHYLFFHFIERSFTQMSTMLRE